MKSVDKWLLVGIGIFLVVISVGGFIIPVASTGFTITQVNQVCNSDFGQLAQMFAGDLLKICQDFQLMVYGIYAAGIIGIALIIIGLVIPLKKKTVCSYCNFVGKTENDLLEHMGNNHLDKSPYKCGECDFIGITEEILWNHYKDKHPDKKKW